MADFATLGIRVTSTGIVQATSELNRLDRQSKQSERAVESLMTMLNKLKGLMALGFGAQGLSSILQMADKMQSLNAQVKFVTRSTLEYNQVQRELFSIAQSTRASLEATTTLYTRSAKALKDYGYSQKSILNFTETLNKAMAVGGVGAQEQASALFQLSQALGSGRLQGDEFKTIAETAPIILDVVAKYMGKSRAEVKQLASDGKITSQLLFQAITGASADIAKSFDQMPLTFGQAMQKMENQALRFVDQFATQTGVFNRLAEGVSFLSDHFELLAVAMGLLASGHLAKFVASMTSATVGAYKQAQSNLEVARTAQTQISAELALARVNQQVLASQLALAQSSTTLKAIRSQMAQQAQLITNLAQQETAALNAVTAAKNSASVAGRALNGVMSLLGGPAGAITIATMALFYFVEKANAAREKALDLENANQLLANSYQDLSLAAAAEESRKQAEGLRQQREEIEKLQASIATTKSSLENLGFGNPFFDYNKTRAELDALEDKLKKALDVESTLKQAFDKPLRQMAQRMFESGKTVADFREKIALMGVDSETANRVLEGLNPTLINITGELQRMFPNIDTSKISMDGLVISVGDFKLLAPSATSGATNLAAGITQMATAAAIGAGNLQALLGQMNELAGGAPGDAEAEKLIKASKLSLAIAKAKTPQEIARLKRDKYMLNIDPSKFSKERLDELSRTKEQEFLAQEMNKDKKSKEKKSHQQDQYQQISSQYSVQLAEMQTDTQSIAQYGGVSLYKEYDQLMARMKTDRETFKKMTSSQIDELKKMAQALDQANMAKQVAQFSYSKGDELDQMEFELQLIGKTAKEQEQLNYYRKIDNDIKQLSIGMSDEYIQKLLAEGEALKKNYDEIQKLKDQKKSDPLEGISDGFKKFGDDAENVMGNVSNITQNALNGMSDALTQLVMTGKADFGSLARSIIKDIIQMTIKMMIFKAVSSMFGAGASGGGFADGSWNFFRGGLVGFDEGGFTGLGGKYQPAGIVHKGEYVLTKEATSRLGVDYLDWLNYQSRSKPKGFANGGAVGATTTSPIPNMSLNSGTPKVSVTVVNNGAPVNTDVKTEQRGDEVAITLTLMQQIAEKTYNDNLNRDLRPSGGRIMAAMGR